jgi:hypothetical protein
MATLRVEKMVKYVIIMGTELQRRSWRRLQFGSFDEVSLEGSCGTVISWWAWVGLGAPLFEMRVLSVLEVR